MEAQRQQEQDQLDHIMKEESIKLQKLKEDTIIQQKQEKEDKIQFDKENFEKL